MGFVSDTCTLMAAGTVCAAGAITTGAGTVNFAGSNFTRGVIRVNVTAQSGTQTGWGIVIQSTSDGGTTWFPAFAAIATPAASAATPGSGYIALGTTAAAGQYQVLVESFPGATFRVGLAVTGGTSVTAGITGDFQKAVPDNA